MKALTISNGRLAADLAVDKSLVGRWVAGSVRPSAHNLGRLTAHLATRLPGFSLLDWERDLESLGSRLGGASPGPAALPQTVPQSRSQSAIEVHREGQAWPGLYAHFRMAFRNTGDMLVELMIIWREGDGLRFRSFDPSFSHTGEILLVRHQLFFIGEDDARADGLNFLVLNGVGGQKAFRTDGIALSVAGDRHRTPGACASVLQRIADLPDATSVPPRATLLAICARMQAAFAEGRVAGIAGPEIERSVRPIVGAARADGQVDHILRTPLERSLAASEVELHPALIGDLERVRDAFVTSDIAAPLGVDYAFRSPQLSELR